MKKIFLLSLLLLLQINVYASNDLKDLAVNNKLVSCLGYECNIEIDDDTAEFTYELGENVKDATPKSGHKVDLSNDYSVTIEVTYNDDTTANYVVNIKKHIKSSDNSLKKLTINDEEIELKKDVFVYGYDVKFDDEVVLINGEANDSNATLKEIQYDFALEKSSLSIEYPVTAENGDIKKYTIVLKRKNKPDTTLKTLTLSEIELDFKKDKLDYEVTIPYSVDSTEIKAIANSLDAEVSISMDEFFKVGENFIKIKVTNQEAYDTYVVKINRLEKVDEELANLESLTISGYELDFIPNVLEYDLVFNEIPDSLEILAKAVSPSAKVEIIDNENLEDKSIVFVKVSLEDNLSKVYRLNINLENKDETKDDDINKTLVVILIVVLVIIIIILLILQIKGNKPKKKKKNNSKKQEEEIEVI